MLSQWCHSLLAWQPLLEGEWGMQEPSLPEARGVPKRRSPLCSRLESSSACLRLSWAAPCTRWECFFSVWAVTQRQSHHRAVTSCFTSLNAQCCFWFCKLKHAESKPLKKNLFSKKKRIYIYIFPSLSLKSHSYVSLLITLFKEDLSICVALAETALENSAFCGPKQWLI